METVPFRDVHRWLKRRLKITKKPKDVQPNNAPERRPNNLENNAISTSQSACPYPGTLTCDHKRKISWEDIVRPLKSRRIEKDERRPLNIVHGSFSLNDIRGAMFPGHQTAATSLCAILMSKSTPPVSWSTGVMDKLLLQGDKLHSTRITHLNRNNGHHVDLQPDDLPDRIALSQREYSIQYSTISRESLSDESDHCISRDYYSRVENTNPPALLLKQCLQQQHAGTLLTVNNTTVAIFCDKTYCYLFNGCRITRKHFTMNDKEACLLKFRDTDHLTSYISQKLVKDSLYRLTIVDVIVDFDAWAELSFTPKLPLV